MPSIDAEIPAGVKPVGYEFLTREYHLEVLPHHVQSFLGRTNERQTLVREGKAVVIYPKRTRVGETWVDHLEFALRYEGLHPDLIGMLFNAVDEQLLVERLRAKPGGRYLRRAWYCYEELTGSRLPVPDLKAGNYVDLLDPEVYYTGSRRRIQRQRIHQNLLGDLRFCALVRRTETLREFEDKRLDERTRKAIAKYPPELFQRALRYLYRKETKSSFEIEKETPDQRRASQFVHLLLQVESRDSLTKGALVALQQAIVDSRFANQGYRNEVGEQIYVGTTAGWGREIVHFVGPKPADVPLLMDAFLDTARGLRDWEPDLPAVIAAAITAYAFVFLHPFSDGNGRIHRFLLHHVLARKGFSPNKVIFPVSAVMLNRPLDYDRSLESFSQPLMERVDYELDDEGRLTVRNETADYYRFIDYTTICETVYAFIEETIEKELPAEFAFLQHYDEARRAMREIVDLPERIADLFVRLVVQNRGRMSRTKRKLSSFEKLRDEEVEELEAAVRKAFRLEGE